MSKFRNVSPLGDLDVPVLGRVVKAGETVDVPADLVAGFEVQPDVWSVVVVEKKGE